jgi:hypothetical protein
MATWRERYHYQGNLWMHQPEVVYQQEISVVSNFTTNDVVYILVMSTSGTIQGTFSDVKPNMTVLIGTRPGESDIGRTRVVRTLVTTFNNIYVFVPKNNHDGEINPVIGNYITVIDEYRVWMKPPFAIDGDYWYDGVSGPQGCTYEQVPIANGGAAYAGELDASTQKITVSFDASASFAVADDAVLGAYTADLFGGGETLTASSGTPANAIDGNPATYWQPTTDNHEYMHVDFGVGVEYAIRKSTLTCSTNYGPTQWSLQWSDDNTNWVTVFYEFEAAWGVNEQRTYENHHAGEHRYWRLYAYASTGGFALRIEEWELFAEDRTSGASPYLWDVGDGTITVGSTTTEAITATFPEGFRYVELTITDTNAEEGVTQIPVVGVNKPRTVIIEADYSGGTPTASTGTASFAFDNNRNTKWLTPDPNPTGWLKMQFPTAQTVLSYDVDNFNGFGVSPTGWTLEGSNDDIIYTVLDTQTGVTFSGDRINTYTIATPGSYLYYKLDVTGSTGTQIWIAELNLYVETTFTATTGLVQNFTVNSHTMEQPGQVYEFGAFESLPTSEFNQYISVAEISYAGGTPAADSVNGANVAANAFDNNNGTYWEGTAPTGWVQITYASDQRIVRYGVYATQGSGAPTSIIFRGWDGAAYHTLDTQTGLTWSGAEEKTFDLAEPVEYERYRLTVNATDTGDARVYELNLYDGVEQFTPLYIDGGMALYWEDEYYDNVAGSLSAAGATGREHMRLHGWIDTEQNDFEGLERAIDERLVLRCLDTGQRLQQLIDFTFMAQRDAAPIVGYEMKHANMDVYFYLMARWLSTATEVTDFIWSHTCDHYNFGLLAAQGANIYDMINQKARAIDHIFTCNKMGQLKIVPDLRNCASEFRASAATAEALTAADYTPLSYVYTRTARYHWAYGSGVGFFPYDADHGSFAVDARFTIAPGQSPGQGVTADTEHERLISLSDSYDSAAITPVTSFNERTGRSYAQKAAYRSLHQITLVHAGDTGLDPAEAQWVNLTIPATLATYRGRTLDAAPGIIIRITEQHNHSAMTKTVSIEWEEFISDFVEAWSYSPS